MLVIEILTNLFLFFKSQRKADGNPTYFLIDEIQLVAPKENP